MTRATRGVSFNLNDPIESKIYEMFEDRNLNFSKYVKRLLERELITQPKPIIYKELSFPDPDPIELKQVPKPAETTNPARNLRSFL